uniref:(northern house mosquito) hypothetical protein n=1 Tax=Culex pipiens TaxID=7175 RepID=A0A8D8GBM3_CULPI
MSLQLNSARVYPSPNARRCRNSSRLSTNCAVPSLSKNRSISSDRVVTSSFQSRHTNRTRASQRESRCWKIIVQTSGGNRGDGSILLLLAADGSSSSSPTVRFLATGAKFVRHVGQYQNNPTSSSSQARMWISVRWTHRWWKTRSQLWPLHRIRRSSVSNEAVQIEQNSMAGSEELNM